VTPTIDVRVGGDGLPTGATARAVIACTPARAWAVLEDLDRYPQRVPMIDRIQRDGSRVTIGLRFKIAFLSVKFSCVVEVRSEPGRRLELAWLSGEPRGIRLAFEIEPAEGGQATLLRSDAQFDVYSLGWVTKYFLRHHPEIQYGIFPGVALALLDSVRKAAERAT
jgi:carbon monoxide dehydrogenase subunit G